MYPHLPERVMRQFRVSSYYSKTSLYVCSSNSPRKDHDVILNGFYSHLVSVETRSVPMGEPLAYAQGYINWFYRVSHPYMTPDVAGVPPRHTHQEILEEKRAINDNTSDLLLVCKCIVTITTDTIER